MRKITETHTGKIVTDTDLTLGYDKRINKVKHKPVDITDKLVVTVSSQKGCPMNCNFCDCPIGRAHCTNVNE